jgi:hypothetical protein
MNTPPQITPTGLNITNPNTTPETLPPILALLTIIF